MFLEICIQIYFVVFTLSPKIDKQMHVKTINLLCKVNKDFLKYHSQRGVFNPKTPFAYALALKVSMISAMIELGTTFGLTQWFLSWVR